MVVEYDFYIGKYGGGVIPETAWKRLVRKADVRLKSFTFERLGEVLPENAQFALCEMAECIYADENRSGKTSENNDGYSVSYETSQTITDCLYKIALSYLLHTGLMDLEG